MTSPLTRRSVRTPLVVTLGVAAAVGLSACSGSGDSGALPGNERPVDATQAASSSDPSVRASAPPEVTEAVATRTAAYDGDRVRVEVLSLRRSGDLSTLQLRETYLGTEYYSINNDLGGGAASYDLSGITLVDTANGKRYLTAHDSDDDCVCSSTSGVQIKPGSSYTLSATFAAPPDDVRSIDVAIPGLGTIADVPVS